MALPAAKIMRVTIADTSSCPSNTGAPLMTRQSVRSQALRLSQHYRSKLFNSKVGTRGAVKASCIPQGAGAKPMMVIRLVHLRLPGFTVP